MHICIEEEEEEEEEEEDGCSYRLMRLE